MTQFDISKIGSFQWYDFNYETPYNSDPLNELSANIPYCQPVQIGGSGYQSDTGQVQLTSDVVPTCKLYDRYDTFIKDVPLVPISPPILGVAFICYNGNCDFSDVAPGIYYLRIVYTDDLTVVHDWRTLPLNCQIYHDGTQLIEATNNKNDKGIVFVNSDGTTLVIKHRVKSFLYLPLAKTDAVDYEDQYNDLTQQESIPFMTLTQYLGGPELLPFGEIELINLLYSLSQVLIEGNALAKISDSEFTPTERTILPGGAFWTVALQPNEAYNNNVYITGDDGGGDYIVIKQAKTFKNQAADFAFTGNFTAGKNLIRIAVVNNGGDVFVMTVGTTDGGNELGEISFPSDDTDSIDIGKLFTVPTDVYIGGITGTDLDITFDWNDYLAKNTIPGTDVAKWQKNNLYYFDEVDVGSFATEFDVSTGLGNVGTDHEGCALADGRNGVPNREGLIVQVWKHALPLTRGIRSGNADNEITITRAGLPHEGLNTQNGDTINVNNPTQPSGGYMANQHNAGTQRDYLLQQSLTLPDRGPTEFMGDGDPTDITPDIIILPAFYYIGV